MRKSDQKGLAMQGPSTQDIRSALYQEQNGQEPNAVRGGTIS